MRKHSTFHGTLIFRHAVITTREAILDSDGHISFGGAVVMATLDPRMRRHDSGVSQVIGQIARTAPSLRSGGSSEWQGSLTSISYNESGSRASFVLQG